MHNATAKYGCMLAKQEKKKYHYIAQKLNHVDSKGSNGTDGKNGRLLKSGGSPLWDGASRSTILVLIC